MSQEFDSVLARTIAAIGDDKAQIRTMIYHLARLELLRKIDCSDKFERRDEVSALEAAISSIETEAEGAASLLTYSAGSHRVADEAHQTLDDRSPRAPDSYTERPLQFPSLPPLRPIGPTMAPLRSPRAKAADVVRHLIVDVQWKKSVFIWYVLPLLTLLLVCAGTYSSVWMRGTAANAEIFHKISDVQIIEPDNAKLADYRSQSPPTLFAGAPLPQSYGVYATNRGALFALQPLPIRVPDPRVAISAMISNPSPTVLADGNVKFVVFRREVASIVMDRVLVRIVARVVRALTFDPRGKAKTIVIEGSWAVRSTAYAMRVFPMSDNSEMMVIEPEDSNFSFPPGRYALALKGGAYDFSVDGSITDTAQCLERTEALNAPVYTECRNP